MLNKKKEKTEAHSLLRQARRFGKTYGPKAFLALALVLIVDAVALMVEP